MVIICILQCFLFSVCVISWSLSLFLAVSLWFDLKCVCFLTDVINNAWFFFTVARTCSLIFIVLDVLKPLGDKKLIEKELEGFGIRLNKKPANIHYKMKEKGGINFQAMVRTLSSDVLAWSNLFCDLKHDWKSSFLGIAG